jgi:ADP-heptose:LPS heptosyltransferase
VEILILHPGGLGDILLSLPAISLIRRACPSARITLAGNIDHLAAIVSGYADRFVSLSTLPLHRLYMPEPIPKADGSFWNAFDWIVSWTGFGDPTFASNFARVHANVCIAPWRPCPDETRHVSQLFVDSLNLDSLVRSDASPAFIALDANLREKGRQWFAAQGWDGQDPLIALHPGAGSRTKRWPIQRFADLARCLWLQKKARLLIISGPAEPGLADPIMAALPAAAAFRADSMPLNLAAALLAQCTGFVGNDSGIAHLAASLGIRSTVLFGPTLPQHWAPLGKHVTVIRDASGCRACVSRSGEHTCLQNITVEKAIDAMQSRSDFWQGPGFVAGCAKQAVRDT